MKRLLSVLTIMAIMLTFIAGCSGNSPSNESVSENDGGSDNKGDNGRNKDPVKITIAHNQGEKPGSGGWPHLEAVAKAYNEKSGNTVEWIYVPAGEMAQWTQTQFVGGTAPDIIWNQGQPASDFLKNKWIIDLKPHFEEGSPYTGKAWKDSFQDGVLKGVVDFNLGEAMVGMPIAFVQVHFFYNKDLLAAAGLPDEAPKTWTQVLDYAKKLKEHDENVIPFSVQNSMDWNLGWIYYNMMMDLWTDVVPKLDVINQNGMLDVSEQALGVQAGLIKATDPRMVDYYTFMKQLSKYFNKGFNTASWEYEGLFNEGKSAMQVNGSWYYKQHIDNGFKVNYGAGPVPYVDDAVSSHAINKQRKYAVGQLGPDMVVTRKAEDEGRADAAVDFLRFLTDPGSGGKLWVEQSLLAPVIKDVEVPDVLKNVIANIGEDQVLFGSWSVTAFTPEAGNEYQVMYRAFLEDNTTPAEFAKKVQKLVEQACEDAIKDHPEWKVEEHLDKVK